MTLVATDPDVRPNCGHRLSTLTWSEPALFWFGGYGAMRTTTVRSCRCGWGLLASVTSDNPRGTN